MCRSVLHSALNFVSCSAAHLFDCIGYNTIKNNYEESTFHREAEWERYCVLLIAR